MGSVTLADELADDEIDLGQYLRVLFRHWPLVIGLAALGALAALGVSFVQPRLYEARAVVAVTKPQAVLNLQSPGLPDLAPTTKALIALATSDDVLAALGASPALASVPAEERTAGALREWLTAEAGADPSLLVLKVRARDPGEAAAVANAWADVVISRGREVYGLDQGGAAYFEARLADADANLARAEASLAAFQARSELNVATARLNALLADERTYLAEKQSVARIAADVESLRKKLSAYRPDVQVAPADELTALLLQMRAYDSQAAATAGQATAPVQIGRDDSDRGSPVAAVVVAGSQANSPVQLQVGGTGALSGRRAGELLDSLRSLSEGLSARSSGAQARLDELVPQIKVLQGQVQQLKNEEDRLTLARDVARDTYQAVARKVQETQGVNNQVLVASRALPPDRPASSGRALMVAAAGLLGLIIGATAAFVVDWWRGERAVAAQAPTEGQPVAQPSKG